MKKYLKLIACFALVAAISVGATLAYLQTTMDTKENKFISSQKIKGELEEPNWKPGEKNISADGTWNYLPNEIHGKDPKISITSDSVDAYIAMKVDFFDEYSKKISYEEFSKKYATLSAGEGGYDDKNPDFSNNWDDYSDNANLGPSKFFVFNEKLSNKVGKETTTESLFDYVKVNPTVVANKDGDLPSFRIDITGYAVQAEQITQEEAIAELVKMATTTKN